MPLTEGPESATEQWEVFALALTASLGPFEPVYLAPKFPSHVLNTALATYLSLNDDELLLAIIDRGRRNESARCCALTSRRIYWTEQERQRQGPLARGTASDSSPERKHQFVVRVADYGVLPDHLDVITTPEGASASPSQAVRQSSSARSTAAWRRPSHVFWKRWGARHARGLRRGPRRSGPRRPGRAGTAGRRASDGPGARARSGHVGFR